MAALLGPLVIKALPYFLIAIALGSLAVAYLRARNRKIEDKMEQQRDQSQNELSQVNAVKTVEEDMAQTQVSRPTLSQVKEREKNGTF